MGAEHTEDLDQLLGQAEAAFRRAGLDVAIVEEIQALTASADGGAWFALRLVGAEGFIARFGELLADDLHSIPALVHGLRESRTPDLILDDGTVYVLVEADLPEEALLQLRAPLSQAPSGELRYDRALGTWRDPTQPL